MLTYYTKYQPVYCLLQDGQWLDIDYMDKWFVFTYSKDTFSGLPELIKKLHREGQRVVVTVVSVQCI